MFLHAYVNNWQSVLEQDLTGGQLYLPQAALDLLPDISADADIAIPLVVDDGNGNYEFVEAYQKQTGYLTVSRDMFNRYLYNQNWATGTPVYCRPFAELMTLCQQSYWRATNYAPSGATQAINPRGTTSRFAKVTLSQDLDIVFYTSSVTTPLFERSNRFTLALTQDATGGHAVTFTANILWEGGSQPAFDTTPNSVVLIDFYEVDLAGNVWVASVVANGAR